MTTGVECDRTVLVILVMMEDFVVGLKDIASVSVAVVAKLLVGCDPSRIDNKELFSKWF